MMGFYPGIYWRVCWTCCPFFIALIFGLALYETSFQPLELPYYVYPQWSVYVGWILRMLSVLSIPAYMFYMLVITRGTLFQRLKIMIKPQQRHASMNSTCPSIAIMDDKTRVVEPIANNHLANRRCSGAANVAHL